jgi:hypothetical protein
MNVSPQSTETQSKSKLARIHQDEQDDKQLKSCLSLLKNISLVSSCLGGNFGIDFLCG